MKTYTKILGIFNAIILIVGIVALVAFTADEQDWLITSLFIIPIYLNAHYLIATRFGFKKHEPSKQTSIITISLSVLTLILVGIIPLTSWNSYKKITNELETSRDWGQDTTLYNIRTDLKTKLIDNQLNYVFKARFDKKRETPNIGTYIVKLYDADGFEIEDFEIKEWTGKMDSLATKQLGIDSFGKIYWSDWQSYREIDSYNVAVRWAD